MVSPIVLAALCGMILLALACVRRIPRGQVYTLRGRDGRIRTLGEGLHVVLPLLERVAHKIDLAGATVAVNDLRRGERDYRAVVYFQVVDPRQADVVIDDVEGLLRVTTRRLFDYRYDAYTVADFERCTQTFMDGGCGSACTSFSIDYPEHAEVFDPPRE